MGWNRSPATGLWGQEPRPRLWHPGPAERRHLIGVARAVAMRAATAAAFSPTDVAGLLAWWDGGLSDKTYSVGAEISQLDDLSGHGNHLLQDTAGERPDDATTTINGIPAIFFDGGGEFLEAGTSIGITTAFHIFIVANIHAEGSGDEIIGAGASSDTNDGHLFRMVGTGGDLALLLSDGTTPRDQLSTANAAFVVDTPSLFESFANGATTYGIAVDGAVDTGTPSNGGCSGPDSFVVGFNCHMSVVAGTVYDHILTGGDLTNVRAYLNTRFAL